MQEEALTADEQKFIDLILADPIKKYQLLQLMEKELQAFFAWQEQEEIKRRVEEKDKNKISFLKQLISRFQS